MAIGLVYFLCKFVSFHGTGMTQKFGINSKTLDSQYRNLLPSAEEECQVGCDCPSVCLSFHQFFFYPSICPSPPPHPPDSSSWPSHPTSLKDLLKGFEGQLEGCKGQKQGSGQFCENGKICWKIFIFRCVYCICLRKKHCPSVGPSICWSVHLSIFASIDLQPHFENCKILPNQVKSIAR